MNSTTKQNSSASLTCVEILKPPERRSKRFVSNTDSLLSSYSAKYESTAESPVWQCTWSSDGTILATCHGRPDPCIRLWKYKWNAIKDKSNWSLTATLRDEESDTSQRTIRSIAFAPVPQNVRQILAAASFDGSISIWEDFSSESNGKKEYEYASGRIEPERNIEFSNAYQDTACGWECTAQLEGHENEVKDVTWNATGTLLASCGRDKSVWVWECFLPGTIGGGGNGSTSIMSGGEGDFECLAVLQSHTGDVKSVVFAPSHGQFGDGDEILLSSSYDDTIKCWAEDAGDWYCALTLSSVHTSTIWNIAVSPGGVRMVSGSADKSLALWRCYTASEKRELEDEKERNATMHSDGLWKCVGKLPSAHDLPILSVDCAPSRAGHGRIVSGGGDDINVYREVGGSTHAPLFAIDANVKMAHEGEVNCVKWHPMDGKLLASAGDDGLVKIWNYNM